MKRDAALGSVLGLAIFFLFSGSHLFVGPAAAAWPFVEGGKTEEYVKPQPIIMKESYKDAFWLPGPCMAAGPIIIGRNADGTAKFSRRLLYFPAAGNHNIMATGLGVFAYLPPAPDPNTEAYGLLSITFDRTTIYIRSWRWKRIDANTAIIEYAIIKLTPILIK